MGKNKENNTGENFKKRMEKIGKDGTGERSDEDDKSRKKLKRSPNKNPSDPDSINSGDSEFFWKSYLRMEKRAKEEMIFQLDLP